MRDLSVGEDAPKITVAERCDGLGHLGNIDDVPSDQSESARAADFG
jgi:hypothetical protein